MGDLVQKCLHVSRNCRLKMQAFTGSWVLETQAGGVKRLPGKVQKPAAQRLINALGDGRDTAQVQPRVQA